MSGNTFGTAFRVTTFGESHGLAVGATVDGCPAGLPLSKEDIQVELDRRRPGTSAIVSSRKEKDQVEILSGVLDGTTIGTPIEMLVYNLDVDSSSYVNLENRPRPGHADLTYQLKYGKRDHRGGGRASGRETVGRAMGGAVAKKLIGSTHGIQVAAHAIQIGSIRADVGNDLQTALNGLSSEVRCADPGASEKMVSDIEKAAQEGDSLGGIVQVIASGVPAGVGEPVFDKLDAQLAKALMSIGSVKAVEFGAGMGFAGMRGSDANDAITAVDGSARLMTNRSGGVLGGISTGNDIVINFAVKPTPSISKVQQTLDLLTMDSVEIRITGRHDACIVPRIVPVAESMVAVTLADMMIRGGFINPSRV
jgi:chorismate synthase